MTYSIVAVDLKTQRLGVAVASGSIAVGSRVPWAEYPIAAVATQGYTNPSFGRIIISLIKEGLSPEQALHKCLSQDRKATLRQVLVIAFKGVVAYTGKDLPDEKGHIVGDTYACGGNLLATKEVITTMANAFEKSDEDLIWKLIKALKAGSSKGGDKRGDKSAAVLVVGKTLYGRAYDKIIDIRVDYGDNPVNQLSDICKKFLNINLAW